MAENLRILPEAVADATEAYRWYEARRPGLGEEFLSSVDACIHFIRRNPELFERIRGDFRRATVRRFPYVVFFKHTTDETVIYSVFHSAQDPEKWRARLK